MNEQISNLPRELEGFEEDSKWFYEHIELLREYKLVGKFVAIKNKKVMASDENLNNVVKDVEEKGENPAYIVIEFVYPKGTVILL